MFLDLCRDAARAAELRQWSQREYELLSATRRIAGGCRLEPTSIANGRHRTAGRLLCMSFDTNMAYIEENETLSIMHGTITNPSLNTLPARGSIRTRPWTESRTTLSEPT